MCMRLNPIVKNSWSGWAYTFSFEKHVKDDEIGVILREQGSSNVTNKRCGHLISTVVVQIVHVYSRRDYINKK